MHIFIVSMHANLKPMTSTEQVIIRRCCKDYMTPAAPVKSSTEAVRNLNTLMSMRRGIQELLNQVVILNLNILSKSRGGIFSPALMIFGVETFVTVNIDKTEMMKNICQNVLIKPMLPGQQTPINQNYLASLCKTHHWLFMGPHLSSLAKPSELPCCLLSTRAADLQHQTASWETEPLKGLTWNTPHTVLFKRFETVFLRKKSALTWLKVSYDFYFGYKILYFK